MEIPAFTPEDQPKWTRLPIRTRPHRNPLADNDDGHPDCPEDAVTRLPLLYPEAMQQVSGRRIEFVDVGCAFGGMLFALAPHFPNTLMLGLEIRPKVVDFAHKKALEMRRNAEEQNKTAVEGKKFHHYHNVAFEQLNVMKFGSNWFDKGQLSKIFFCYPDPHWKRKNIRRRIISPGLVQEYAYWLRVGGLIYTVSDVAELEEWMVKCLDECPMFRRMSAEELEAYAPGHAKIMSIVTDSSEDAQRTARKGFTKNFAVHMRIDPQQFTA